MKSFATKILSSLQQNTAPKDKGKGVRFLYSQTSRILSIHYFNLQPYLNSEVHSINVSQHGNLGELKPVFLARSLTIMKSLRPDFVDSEIENGLIFR